jgi:hypothetical protein
VKTVFSCGFGVQSTGILGMMCKGVIPKPDYVVFSDPGAESEATYRHSSWCIELAAKHGIRIDVVKGGDIWNDAITFAERRENAGIKRYASIPLFVKNNNGREGMMPRQCTKEYKIEPIEEYHRRVVLALKPRQRAPKEPAVEVLIGISADEERRATPPGRWKNISVKTGQQTIQWDAENAHLCEEMKTEKKWFPTPWQLKTFPLLGYTLYPDRSKVVREEYAEVAGFDRQDILNWFNKAFPGVDVPRSACVFCLAGETQVITPEGERPIRDLVGRAILLVPAANGSTFSNHGRWQEAEVRSFGVQKLHRIELARGRSVKVVHATADHRWVLGGKVGFTTTTQLKPGDCLASCHRPPVTSSGSPVVPSPFGIAHGFTFGDGSVGVEDRRPAYVEFFGEKAILARYFSECPMDTVQVNGGPVLRVTCLPRAWKQLPALNESRSYLLGWLAGYFAADGTVSKSGRQAVLYSSELSHLQVARAACYELGVVTSPIISRMRVGFGVNRPLHSLCIAVKGMPASFWLLKHHAERAASFVATGSAQKTDWVVRCVEETDRVEEVFCAVVEGAERFTLADNLLTGNCPYRTNKEWLDMKENSPGEFAKAVEFDERIRAAYAHGPTAHGHLSGVPFVHRTLVPLAQVDLSEPLNDRKGCGGLFSEEPDGICGV